MLSFNHNLNNGEDSPSRRQRLLKKAEQQIPRGYGRCTSQRFPGELITAGRSHRSHLALTANIEGMSRFTCWARTSLAVNSATNSAGAAAFSTLARPPASSRSTRHNTPTISNPNSRAASTAWMVEPPVVHTSSTITTRANFCRNPSMRWPMPYAFSALRTRKPVSYTHLRAHETDSYLVCRLL